ncbi:hypothetical protein AT728_07550 [Streptomyces silvensis]|uniref:Uncharacterized protein n=1 Tax=Streptomyces silvensis TaxID=1765722 RepID=A0A0W7X7Q4_9ACTN|nr:hypothetical protein AT728_07550 [Streptomyces silvensis]
MLIRILEAMRRILQIVANVVLVALRLTPGTLALVLSSTSLLIYPVLPTERQRAVRDLLRLIMKWTVGGRP